MKNPKQLQVLLSTVFMVWMSLAAYAQNVGNEFTIDDIRYKITSTTEVEIVGYLGTEKEVTILQTVNDQGIDYEVTAIGNRAFHLKQLTKVTFNTPSNVTSIGQDAFFQNQLTGVLEIPDSVTDIGQRAFGSNKEMTEVTIPNGVTRIEQWAFAQNGLTKVTIPASVESIGKQAFFANNDLDLVTIKRNPPPTYEPDTFQARSGGEFLLINFDLVVPFEAIEAYENEGWTDYGNVTSGITSLEGVKYGIVDSPTEATVIDITGNNSTDFNLVVPETIDIDGNSYPVTAIGDNAFQGAGDLLQLALPRSMKNIGFQAFYTAIHINRIIMRSNEPPTLDPDAFEYPYRSERINLIVPEGKVEDYKKAGWTGFKDIFSFEGQIHINSGFHWKVTKTLPNEMEVADYVGTQEGHMEIPSEVVFHSIDEEDPFNGTYLVTSIGDNAFWRYGFYPLTSVDIPDAVTSIGDCAFCGNDLTEVVIPGAVTWIGKNAFLNNNITSVEIPESVTSIGEQAFAQNELTSVTTPSNVSWIRRWTYSSNLLTEVTISSKVTRIDLYAFLDNPDLRLVTVEANNPPFLDKNAFSNAYRDQIDLVVPTGTIEDYLDNGWDGFRSISYGIFTVDGIRYGITSPTEVMVVDYTGTSTEVSIPETVDHSEENSYTVTAIKENAFQNKELANVEIPSSVISIGELAFSNNQLMTVTIPSSVERIDSHAFYNNPDLASVTVEANDPPVLHSTTFANANRHQIDLVVPAGRMQVYEDSGWGGFRSTLDGSAPPQPTIDAPQSIDHLNSFTVNITFDDDVTDFVIGDIQITNATVSVLKGSGSTYAATIAATSLCDGDITIDIPANVAMGANNLPNMAASKASVEAVTFSERCGSEALVGLNRGFSPNGDGIADTLVIQGLKKYGNNVVKIYNLNQQLLFSAHYGGPGDGWDGTYKGSRVPVGSYVCVIDYNEPELRHETKMIYVNY